MAILMSWTQNGMSRSGWPIRTDSIGWSKSVSKSISMVEMVWGSSQVRRTTGCSWEKSATQALVARVGRLMPLVRFDAANAVERRIDVRARFFPAGRRFGVQNSKVSMPMPGGGDWMLDLATALLPAWQRASDSGEALVAEVGGDVVVLEQADEGEAGSSRRVWKSRLICLACAGGERDFERFRA